MIQPGAEMPVGMASVGKTRLRRGLVAVFAVELAMEISSVAGAAWLRGSLEIPAVRLTVAG